MNVASTLPGMIIFGVCAFAMVISTLLVAFAKKPVHAALAMLGFMVPLACVYILLNAPFLAMVQIVVYSGAIMMMFLFVIMLIGTHKGNNPKKGPRLLIPMATLAIVFVAMMVYAIYIYSNFAITTQDSTGDSNPVAISTQLFGSHYFTMQLLALMLITGAIAALLLTHKDKVKLQSQRDLVDERMAKYKQGEHALGQKAMPGVYATSNASNMENISGIDGKPIEESVFLSYRTNNQVGKMPQHEVEIIDGNTGELQ